MTIIFFILKIKIKFPTLHKINVILDKKQLTNLYKLFNMYNIYKILCILYKFLYVILIFDI